MKIIKESKKQIIVLEENDVIEIVTLKKNKQKIEIKCLNNSLHIDYKNIKNDQGEMNEK